MTEASASPTPPAVDQPKSALFNALVGITTLLILLQGLWAGIFLQDASEVWVNVHAGGAYLTVILGIAAAVVAFLRLRSRSDLVAASTVLAVLLVIETGVGSAIRAGVDGLTIVHVPLALFIMGMAVWLPLKARSTG